MLRGTPSCGRRAHAPARTASRLPTIASSSSGWQRVPPGWRLPSLQRHHAPGTTSHPGDSLLPPGGSVPLHHSGSKLLDDGPHGHHPHLSAPASSAAAAAKGLPPKRLLGSGGSGGSSGLPSPLAGGNSAPSATSIIPASSSASAGLSGSAGKRGGLSTRSTAAAAAGTATYELAPRPSSSSMGDAAGRIGGTSSSSSRAGAAEAVPLLGALASKLQSQVAGSSSSVPDGRSRDSSSSGGPEPPGPGGDWLGKWRWQYLVGLCALSVVICYADRSNISTAVLPMSEQFGWDKGFQGVVLSTFFGGYALTQVLGGRLADQYGGKRVLAGGVALWSLFTALTPEAAAAGVAPILAARVALGVGEGVAFPSIHSIISRNVPQPSQSTAVGVVTAASYVGTALAFGVSPLIISKFGWQWVFYLFAAMAFLWLPFWLPLRVTNSEQPSAAGLLKASGAGLAPGHSPRAQDMGGAAAAAQDPEEAQALLSAPHAQQPPGAAAAAAAAAGRGKRGFWALMRRREVWAICAAQYCQSWGMYGLLNWLPTFFKEYYHVEIADLAAYTLAPYVVQGGLGLLSGVIADKMIARGWAVRRVRILLQVLGMLGPAACLMLAVSPAVGGSAEFASSLITVGLGFSALTLGGVSVSHLDIAPRNAGVIFGAGNTTATLAGLLSVPFTGFLLQATGSWTLVFGVTALHYVVGSVLWAMWVGDRVLPEDEDPALERITA